MWEQILKVALESGLWAVLFCVLLMYLLRDARARESKYRETIAALLESLTALDSVSRDVSEALSILRRNDKRRGSVKDSDGREREAANVQKTAV